MLFQINGSTRIKVIMDQTGVLFFGTPGTCQQYCKHEVKMSEYKKDPMTLHWTFLFLTWALLEWSCATNAYCHAYNSTLIVQYLLLTIRLHGVVSADCRRLSPFLLHFGNSQQNHLSGKNDVSSKLKWRHSKRLLDFDKSNMDRSYFHRITTTLKS